MNPFLALGQILVSIAVMVAILLQARGTGLSAHFPSHRPPPVTR